MSYVTVFEITQRPFQWWFPAIGFIAALVGALIIFVGRKWSSKRQPIVVGYCALAFGVLWAIGVFGFTYSDYTASVNAYRNGNYAVVEGRVEKL